MAQLRRIYIAGGLAMFRAGLRRMIETEPDLCVVGMGGNAAAEVLEKLQQNPCDLLVLDLGDQPARCIDLMVALHTRFPSLPLLALSASSDSSLVRAALEAGALGFVSMASEPEHLLDALRTLLSARHYVDPRLAYEVLVQHTPSPAGVRLSPRESEVLQGLMAGYSNVEIARQLSVSEKTVSAHKVNLMQKLQVHSLAELIRHVERSPHLLTRSTELA